MSSLFSTSIESVIGGLCFRPGGLDAGVVVLVPKYVVEYRMKNLSLFCTGPLRGPRRCTILLTQTLSFLGYHVTLVSLPSPLSPTFLLTSQSYHVRHILFKPTSMYEWLSTPQDTYICFRLPLMACRLCNGAYESGEFLL
jgi:hypothetical protein